MIKKLIENTVKLFFIFTVFFWGLASVFANLVPTIHSTNTGGKWGDSLTWQEGRIPIEGDIVEINGIVDIEYTVSISGLRINSDGILKKYQSSFGYATLTVNGDTIINGILGGDNSPYAKLLTVDFKGNLENNGNVSYLQTTSVYGDVINGENSSWAGNLVLAGLEEDNSRTITTSSNFKPDLYINGNATLLGDIDFQFPIYLNYSNTLYVDGTRNIYIDYLGFGKVYSSNGNGDGESIRIGTVSYVETNIENVEISKELNYDFTGRNVILNGGKLVGDINIETLSIKGSNNITGDTNINGNLYIESGSILKKYQSSFGYATLTVNGDTIIDGVLGGDNSPYAKLLTVDFKGNLENNGDVSYLQVANAYGDIINGGNSSWAGSLILSGLEEDNTRTITTSSNFKPDLSINGSAILLGDINFQFPTYLNYGNTVYVDGTKNIYFDFIGYGKIYSSNGKGDSESIKIGATNSIETNIENVEISKELNYEFTGRNLIINGSKISGNINVENLSVQNNSSLTGDTTVSGNLRITSGSELNRYIYNNGYITLKVNGDTHNEGIIGGNAGAYGQYLKGIFYGNLVNKGIIKDIQSIFVYGGIDNIDGDINTYTILEWLPIENYNDYILSLTGEDEINLSWNQYLLPSSIVEDGRNIYWKVKGDGWIFDSDWTEEKCINVPGCISVGGSLPTPTNPKQILKSPYLEEEEILLGEQIGKYQSGSGVILRASVENPESESYKLAIKYIRNGEETVVYGNSFSGDTGEVVLPYSGTGSYSWAAAVSNVDETELSDWIEFGDNGTDADFALYEGFEPYPYGYKFFNQSPDFSLLDGGLKIENNSITKVAGTKWAIMDTIFPLSAFGYNEKKYLAAFKTLSLNQIQPSIFSAGNCFGMAFSALSQYFDSQYVANKFPDFSQIVGNGDIWDTINIQNDIEQRQWVGYDEAIRTILAHQLYQKEGTYIELEKASYENTTPVDILNQIKDNPEKSYMLVFKGKYGCFLGFFNCVSSAHAVVPYKVEGNKIYIWDNNVSYPFVEDDEKFFAYDQYMEVDIENNTFKADFYNWSSFQDIAIVGVDELLTYQNLGLPAGFSDRELLYTFSGISDFIVKDSQGNKTGFQNGDIFEEIPGSQILTSLNASGYDEERENAWKQIYFHEWRDDLTLEVDGNQDESYTLMIAGGNYYNEIVSVEIHEGEKDIFHSQNGEMILDFDDDKSGEYTLIMDDFTNPEVETVVLNDIQSIGYPQKFSIDWSEKGNIVSYELDTNNDEIFDIQSFLDSESDDGNISGYLTGNTNATMAGWKVYLDMNNDGELQENAEPFTITDKNGYYEFTNRDSGAYAIKLITHQNWEVEKHIYNIFLNHGQNFQNLNFNVEKINGKSKK